MASDRLQENALKLHQGGLNWILGKKKSQKGWFLGWNRLPRGAVECPSLEEFKRCGIERHGHGLVVGLVVLGGSWT